MALIQRIFFYHINRRDSMDVGFKKSSVNIVTHGEASYISDIVLKSLAFHCLFL